MYVALDVETTGLDAQKHQVLQIGAVALTHTDINQCETFSVFVDPTQGPKTGVYGQDIVGEPYALAMNSWILDELAGGAGIPAMEATDRLTAWLSQFDPQNESARFINTVGVNFGSFDWQFLKNLPFFPTKFFGYRHTEVGSRFATPFGPVSMTERFKQIAEKHNIEGQAHEAVFDARCTLAALVGSFAEERIVG